MAPQAPLVFLAVLAALALGQAQTDPSSYTKLSHNARHSFTNDGSERVYEIDVPDEWSLAVHVTASQPVVVLLRAQVEPTLSEFDAAAWGADVEVAASACLERGLAFTAFLSVRCWEGCQSTDVQYNVTTTVGAQAPFRFEAGTTTATTWPIANLTAGHMVYAQLLYDASVTADSQNVLVTVQFTSSPDASLEVRALPQPDDGVNEIFVACPSKDTTDAMQVHVLDKAHSTATLHASSANRGLWIAVTSWESIEDLQLSIAIANATCSALPSATLPFCSTYLPTTVNSPTPSWSRAPALTPADRDARVQSYVQVLRHYVPPACLDVLAHRLCAESFPACGTHATTTKPLCAEYCATAATACAGFRHIVPTLISGCHSTDDDDVASPADGTTCYGGFASSANTLATPAALLLASTALLASFLLLPA